MTEETGDPTPETEAPERESLVLRGTPVAPGLAMGRARRKDYDLESVQLSRVPLERVELELNRFHSALSYSKKQLEELKAQLLGRVPVDHVRILDTHVAYLKDSVFLSDVENLILNEQMSLEGAIAKVILDFDRIFRLVQSETLRERAVDLRDVGIRVLRNLERQETVEVAPTPEPRGTILIASELSIVDMFSLEGDQVLGIITEEGSLTSHAAILARSMRIPTITGVEGLLESCEEGDFLIVDASEGMVRVRPEDIVRDQYREAREAREKEHAAGPTVDWEATPPRTVDREEVLLSATCGNLPEVENSLELGVREVGLYRTELLYLIDREQPSLESLIAHYRSVLEQAGGRPVTFRLLDVDSSLSVGYLHDSREQNPALGMVGVRALLNHEPVLRRQLQAILRAGAGELEGAPRIAIPKVIDCSEIRRVREILFEERFALKKAGLPFHEAIEVGVVIETPASVIGIAEIAGEAAFLIVSLNSLQQYLIAVDREDAGLQRHFERVHPFVLRALAQIVEACRAAERPVSIFGVTTAAPETMTFLIGLGFRQFCIAPVAFERFLASVVEVSAADGRRAVEIASRVSAPDELAPIASGRGLAGQ